ncbi:MAG: glycosyltransferase [Clostridia bacterium]|nr:glycosyltransferase [Clostridia bacterium]
MKNILIVVPTLKLGGSERAAVNTAQIMSKDFQVHFAVFDGKDAVYSPVCFVNDLKLPVKTSKIKKILQVLKRSISVRKIKKREKIDYCISFGPTANLVNVISGRKSKNIINLRGYAATAESPFASFLYRRCDLIICCSREIKRFVDITFPKYASKSFVLYNPFDIESLRAQGAEAVDDFDFSRRTVVTHGRLNAIKNQYRLIKSFSIVHAEHPDVQLLIIGEGEMREKLQKLIDDLGLRSYVNLIGFRSNPFKYLAKSTIFVLSSFSEGFPNALVEGMTFLPAVSVDCPSGPCEILRNNGNLEHTNAIEEAEYGILVKPTTNTNCSCGISDDDKLLAQAICLLLDDENKLLDYRRKSMQRASDFSYESYKANLLHILENS